MNPGSGYEVGDRLVLGSGVDGWDTPAVLEVTTTNSEGGITGAEVVDGGLFSGDDITAPNNYQLDNAQAELLMMAKKQSGQQGEQATTTSSVAEQQSEGIIAM